MTYLGTVLVLMSTPGPSQLLMLSNSMSHGLRKSFATAAGDLTANFLQMVVASIGLVGAIQNSREFFVTVKWAGVAYLAYLGLKQLVAKGEGPLRQKSRGRSSHSLYWQGFVTSAANPKAIIFFAALFPQFIDPEVPLLCQFAILSATYLVLDGFFLSCYGKFAEWISSKLLPSLGQNLHRLSGSFLIGAAIMLGLKDIEPD